VEGGSPRDKEYKGRLQVIDGIPFLKSYSNDIHNKRKNMGKEKLV